MWREIGKEESKERGPTQRPQHHRPPPPATAATAPPAPTTTSPSPPATRVPSPPTNPHAPSFQDAVARLAAYWGQTGCALWLPHNSEVGAGTMNPATFLRVLGPEPWRVAYAEPSVRPDDSRYGANPNRLQAHTQYQVILKPDPGNAQELYLNSLTALGIDVSAHDVRFVEDNWENPALGAWGLGWEVWLDGQEVTQFTYFQQVGGTPLATPAVEITYGLERIVSALQGVTHFTDIVYSSGSRSGDNATASTTTTTTWPPLTYGEMLLQSEYEWSVFNLDSADVPSQRAAFDLHKAEADRLLTARLPIPAYACILKMSHAFNVLDARGAVSVADRAAAFGDMRGLARRVATLWIARRDELGFPLLKEGAVADVGTPSSPPAQRDLPTSAADFVLEVGCEELPPADADAAASQLADRLPPLLARLRLAHGPVTVASTPRRLVVSVEGLAHETTTVDARVRGPPASAAFSKDGAPTRALTGFCTKNGVDPAAVTLEADAKGVDYVWASVREEGRPAAVALESELPSLLSSITFGRAMRWAPGTDAPAFSRPVRWLLALHGGAPLAFTALGVAAGAETRGLRDGTSAPAIRVATAATHADVLAAEGVVLSAPDREAAVRAGAAAAAAAAGGRIPEGVATDALVFEVARLVEAPTPLAGAFDPSFLALPRDVLVMVMAKHQRYFPVEETNGGALLPAFVTVANGACDANTVLAGNEAVLRARFEDAKFFYEADTTRPLASFVPDLAGTAFHRELGSMLDKQARAGALLPALAATAGAAATAALPTATAAATLARTDQATSVVREMTALAGVMGRHYALASGVEPSVADAIFEAALPRSAGDALPASLPGALLAVADRLDSIVGLFAVGGAPTATADPFGLRRAAVGALETLLGPAGFDADLPSAAAAAAALQPVPVPDGVVSDAVTFIERRLEQLLVDRGLPIDAVRAALGARGANPRAAAATAAELAAELAKGGESRLPAAVAALARPARIARGGGAAATVDPSLFDCDEERALAAALADARVKLGASPSVAAFVEAAAGLAAPVDAFFERVFVMCDDPAVRANRLALLTQVAGLADGLARLEELPGF